MKDKITIIMNEYQAIKEFRERCIRNIEETTKTYLIFLGFGATATSFFLEKKIDSEYHVIILVILLIVGLLIYKLNIHTHINFINYTRKLNETRSFFLEFKIPKKYLKLSTDKEHPKFDGIGFLDNKFSRQGSLRIIQILNSIIGSFVTFILIEKALLISYTIYECRFIISMLAGIVIYLTHLWVNDQEIRKAENQAKQEVT